MSAVDDLDWQSPPPNAHTVEIHQEIADALRSRPGQWALVSDAAPTASASAITHGGLKAYRPAGSFEAVTRGSNGKGRRNVYARYVGDQSDA